MANALRLFWVGREEGRDRRLQMGGWKNLSIIDSPAHLRRPLFLERSSARSLPRTRRRKTSAGSSPVRSPLLCAQKGTLERPFEASA